MRVQGKLFASYREIVGVRQLAWTLKDGRTPGGLLDALDYEVYKPMAIRTLADLVDVAKAKFGVIAMSIVHRVGRVSVGSDSVAIACAAVHRAEAFSACAWAMEEVKRVVPIWKQETGPRTPRAPRRPSGARRKTP